jgi:hypothetical protein
VSHLRDSRVRFEGHARTCAGAACGTQANRPSAAAARQPRAPRARVRTSDQVSLILAEAREPPAWLTREIRRPCASPRWSGLRDAGESPTCCRCAAARAPQASRFWSPSPPREPPILLANANEDGMKIPCKRMHANTRRIPQHKNSF